MSEMIVEEEPEPLSSGRSWLDKNYALSDRAYLEMIEFYKSLQTDEEIRNDAIVGERMAAERKKLADEVWPLGDLPGHVDKGHVSKKLDRPSLTKRRTIGRTVVRRFFANFSIL